MSGLVESGSLQNRVNKLQAQGTRCSGSSSTVGRSRSDAQKRAKMRRESGDLNDDRLGHWADEARDAQRLVRKARQPLDNCKLRFLRGASKSFKNCLIQVSLSSDSWY